jgi:ribosomal protein S5
VAGSRFRYVSSLTGYRRISSVCVQATKLHVNMVAAAYISLNKMEKYSLLKAQ